MMEMKPWGMEEKTFLMLMHLSLLAGFIIPFAGIVLPIVMWVLHKDKFKTIDNHGKVILNWLISALIYLIVGGILTVVLVGTFILFVLGIIAIVFPIIGAIKASKGELWAYPLTIKFFKPTLSY